MTAGGSETALTIRLRRRYGHSDSVSEKGEQIEFRILGPLEVLRGGRALRLGGPRQRGLLALLLLHANEPVSRERLIDGLWGERPPETAVNALQVAVHGLRKLLGRERIVSRGAAYLLRVEPEELDARRFETLVKKATRQGPAAAAETLRLALALWHGRPLADLRETPFVRTGAAQLEEDRLAALEARIEADLALGRHADLVGELESLIAEHPFRERLRAQLMLALYSSGRQAEALECYQRAREVLVEELGIEPSRSLQELERAILRQDESLAPVAVKRRKGVVPAPPTPLIGRELELAAVTALLRSGHVRLLTLTGAGGTGKTRLALAAAGEVGSEFEDGAFFVDLAPLADAALVGSTVAHALGVTEGEQPSVVETLKEGVADRELLLVLDNFEHVTEAAPLVSELLAAAPRLKALVTSRALLRISGEHDYPVPPLALPEPEKSRDPKALAGSDAVSLFVARARAANPEFRLSEANASSVADICVALDGLPLALELAAARSNVLSPTQMLQRLERRLDLLTTGGRDQPARQQTLRATLDWSYELLAPKEKRAFASLSVLAGGWRLEAAEAVCGVSVDTHGSLLEKSLVRREKGVEGQPRFRMLETVREYARERHEAGGEAEALRELHARHYLACAKEGERELAGPRQRSFLELLEEEHDNMRAALAWARGARRIDLGLLLAGSLARFWALRGYWSEGRRWLEDLLRVAGGREDGEGRVRALAGASLLAFRQGDYAQTMAFAQQHLELARALEDHRETAAALDRLASAVAYEGDWERATSLCEESAALSRELGDKRALSIATSHLGLFALMMGDLGRARTLSEESLALDRELGDTARSVVPLYNLGLVALREHRHDDAAGYFTKTFEIGRELKDRQNIAYALEGLAAVVTARGEPQRAARMLGTAAAAAEAIGMSLEPVEQEVHDRTAATLLAQLGEERFAAFHEQGRMTPPEAIARDLAV